DIVRDLKNEDEELLIAARQYNLQTAPSPYDQEELKGGTPSPEGEDEEDSVDELDEDEEKEDKPIPPPLDQKELKEAKPIPLGQARAIASRLATKINDRLAGPVGQIEKVLQQSLGEVARMEVAVNAAILKKNIPANVFRGLNVSSELDVNAFRRIVQDPLGGPKFSAALKRRLGEGVARSRAAIASGFLAGDSIPKISRSIKSVVDFEVRGGAARLARTEIHRVASEAQDEFFSNNKDVIGTVVWTSAMDARVCMRCGALDGKEFPVGKAPLRPLHPNCRCALQPRTKSWQGLGFGVNDISLADRRRMSGALPSRINFGQFFGRQSKAFQKEVLGPTRLKMFEKGLIRFDELSTTKRIKPIRSLI
ncbi:hypothetical protein LCGC14_2998590, partial [marine sediment metagenome]